MYFTYKLTMRCVRKTIVAVEKQYYLFRFCVCCLSYSASKMHATYCIVNCSLPGHTLFLHIISQTAWFAGKPYRTKYEFRFSLQLLSETFLILITIERDIIINVHNVSCKEPSIIVW